MVGGMSLRSKRASVCGEPKASSCPSLSVSSMLSTSPSKPATTNASLDSMKPMGVTVLKKHGPYADKGHLITWIDAMRAQSPSRFRPHHGEIPDALDMEAAAYNAWLEKHPSALNSFERVVKLAKSKQIVVFLDYDGTLSPIVANPDRAVMSDEMRATVKELATCFPTAIISGRARPKVEGFAVRLVNCTFCYYAPQRSSHCTDNEGRLSI